VTESRCVLSESFGSSSPSPRSQFPGLLRFSLISFLLLCFTACVFTERVRVGAEALIEKHLYLLKNRRVGIICNQTSVLPGGAHLVDTLIRLGVDVTALLSPEHGIRGTKPAGEKIEDGIDPKTGLPIYSLYGRNRKPTREMLKNVDVLVFDLQDVGARFYTYTSTMALGMEAAAENGKQFIVLDRPNPINGIDIEGPVLDTVLRSFVGMFPIPVRHGMTLGELAEMIRGEWMDGREPLDLVVIPMEGWQRSMWYDETGLPWVSPSPNMTTLATAIVYPGTCFFEATNVSEGRGTEHPFEYIGAPWIDGDSLSMRLNNSGLAGVRFESVQFTPKSESAAATNPKWAGIRCGGVLVHIVNRGNFHPVETGLTMLDVIMKSYPSQFKIQKDLFDRLAGERDVRESLVSGVMVSKLSDIQNGKLQVFKRIRSKYLLY